MHKLNKRRHNEYPFRRHRSWEGRIRRLVQSQSLQVPMASAILVGVQRDRLSLRNILLLGMLLSRNAQSSYRQKKTRAYRRSWMALPKSLEFFLVDACFGGTWLVLALAAMLPGVPDPWLYASISMILISLMVNRETSAYFCCDQFLPSLLAQAVLPDGPRKLAYCYGAYLAHGGLWKSFVRSSYRGRFYMSSDSIYNLCLPLRLLERFLWRRRLRGGWEPNVLALLYSAACGYLELLSGVLLMMGSPWGAYGAILMHTGIIVTLAFPEANLWNFLSALSVWLAMPHCGPPMTLTDMTCALGPFFLYLWDHFHVASHQLVAQHFCSNFHQYEEILLVHKTTIHSVLHPEYQPILTPRWLEAFGCTTLSEMSEFLKQDLHVDWNDLIRQMATVKAVQITADHVMIRVSTTLALHILGTVTENALDHLQPPLVIADDAVHYRLRLWASRDFGQTRYFRIETLTAGPSRTLLEGTLLYKEN